MTSATALICYPPSLFLSLSLSLSLGLSPSSQYIYQQSHVLIFLSTVLGLLLLLATAKSVFL